MTRMIRINDHIRQKSIAGQSDAYRKFYREFDALFNTRDSPRTDEEFEQIYVRDEEFEAEIESFRESLGGAVKFAVGYTGIGKTTAIRHCFSLGVGRTPRFDVLRKELVFPSFLDAMQSDEWHESDLCLRVQSISSMMLEWFPDLRTYLISTQGRKDLYGFIKARTPYALEHGDFMGELSLTDEEYIDKRLSTAQEHDSLIYEANLLKFLILKKYDAIDSLIIILDDIETHSDEFQRNAILSYLKLHDCMKNTEYPANGRYKVNLLISMRPHTYRRHRRARDVEAFWIGRPIVKKRSVDLDQLFEKRFNYYMKTDSRDISNKDSWNYCYNSVMNMNHKFGGRYKDMIDRLCFYNVRETLAGYSVIFANRRWVQGNLPIESAFTVNETEFNFNNVTVVRALACQESEAFFGTFPSPIPNIFLTNAHEDKSILCLLVLKWFMLKSGEDAYGMDPDLVCLSDVLSYWDGIGGHNMANDVREVIAYLFDCKVLRRSIESSEDYKSKDDSSSLQDKDKLYVSPKGLELWSMLSNDSVLLEMLREAAYRDIDRGKFSDKTSFALLQQSRQIEIFDDLLLYISYLCEKEDDLLIRVRREGQERSFISIFSTRSICEYLLIGVVNSIKYTRLNTNPRLVKRLKDVQAKAKSIMRGFSV